jgi:hypothetical protein
MNTKDFWDKLSLSSAFLTAIAAIFTAWTAILAVNTTNDIFNRVVKIQDNSETIVKLLKENFSLRLAEKIDSTQVSPADLKEKIESIHNSIKLEKQYLDLGGRPIWNPPETSEAAYSELSKKVNDAKTQDQKKTILNDFFSKSK